MSQKQLGCGLLALGRPWGSPIMKEPPSTEEALRFLDSAYDAGVRFFDTATAYGRSQRLLGRWLASLSEQARNEVVVATKVGEFWQATKRSGWTNHNFASMKGALDRSVRLLGPSLQVVQIHKATEEVLGASDINRIKEYAHSQYAIEGFGASVSSVADAKYVIGDSRFSHLQIPADVYVAIDPVDLESASERGLTLLINRPFGMGARLTDEDSIESSFQRILAVPYEADVIVLSGTTKAAHLRENNTAFQHSLQ